MPPSTDLAVVLLTQKGDVKQGKLKQSGGVASIASALKKKEAPSTLGHYTFKGKVLWLFGFVEGKAGTENQHHLPPPLEGLTFYGDILVLYSNQATDVVRAIKDATPLKTSDYEQFYTQVLEGDEESEDGDGESEDMEEELPLQEEPEDDQEGFADEGSGSEEDIEEEEEPEAEPEPKRQKLTRAKKVILPQVAEEPELEITSPMCKYRTQVLSLISTMFTDILTPDLGNDLEGLLYKHSLDVAKKQEIRATWSSTAFRDVYFAESRRVLGNLNPKSYVGNTSLLQHFLNGELTLEQIVTQNYYELFPEHWKVLVDLQAKKEKIQLEGDFSRATDRWQCNNCKQRKCTYYELQTRSADEPMTIFIHCLNCGKRWTQ